MLKPKNPTEQAWRDYLDTTRNQISFRYEEVEPWAWRRLQTELKALGQPPPVVARP